MDLTNLAPRPGARHRSKRLGCGESSGRGKTCGKGHKGQKARSGGSIRLGFEGGQMPLARKIPKRGFSNGRFKVVLRPINLGDLSLAFSDGDVVCCETLRKAGLVCSGRGAKILSRGELKRRLIVRGVPVSASAKALILSLGGSVE